MSPCQHRKKKHSVVGTLTVQLKITFYFCVSLAQKKYLIFYIIKSILSFWWDCELFPVSTQFYCVFIVLCARDLSILHHPLAQLSSLLCFIHFTCSLCSESFCELFFSVYGYDKGDIYWLLFSVNNGLPCECHPLATPCLPWTHYSHV